MVMSVWTGRIDADPLLSAFLVAEHRREHLAAKGDLFEFLEELALYSSSIDSANSLYLVRASWESGLPR